MNDSVNSKATVITVLVIVLVLVLTGVYTYYSFETSKKAGPSAAALSLQTPTDNPYTDLDGQPIDLTAFEGQVRVVNSWASWCPFCVNELPDLSTLAAEYKDRGVVILAINRKEEVTVAKSFIEALTNVDGITFVFDSGDAFYKTIGGFSMPETVFYDQSGDVVVHKRGFMELEEMRQHVESALKATNE